MQDTGYVGALGVLHPHLLESALARPQQRIAGKPAYRGIHRKAAALFHSLCANHAFVDGNKRTAVLAVQDFFYANNYVLLLDDDQVVAIAHMVANRGNTPHAQLLDALTERFENHGLPIRTVPLAFREYLSGLRSRAQLVRKWLRLPEEELARIYAELIRNTD
jgi:death on curing protein